MAARFPRRRGASVLAGLVLAAGGCTASPATTDGGPSSEPSATMAASPSDGPESEAPSSSPSASPSASEAPPGPPSLAWEAPEPFDGNPNAVFVDGTTWIVGGWATERGPAAWISTDGRAWTPGSVVDPMPDDTFTGSGLGPIIRLGDALLSYGTFIGCCDGRGVLGWRSADGSSWEPIDSSSPLFERGYLLTGLAAGDPALVAMERQYSDVAARIWRWTAETSWVEVTPASPFANEFGSGIEANDVAWSDGRFVVVGDIGDSGSAERTAAAWVSTDGERWEASAAQPAFENVRLTHVAAHPAGGFLALGQDDAANFGRAGVPVAFTSPDGLAWTPVPAPDAEPSTRPVELLAVPGGLVALGTIGSGITAWTTADGTTWTDAGSLDHEFRAAGTDGEQVVVFTADYLDGPPEFYLNRAELQP